MMIRRSSKRAVSTLSSLMLLGLTAVAPVKAGVMDWATGPSIYDEEGKRDWRIEVSPYLWLSNLQGDLGLPPVGTIPVSATFSDLSSSLDSGFAGLLDVRFRRWHLLSDNSWVKLRTKITPNLLVINAAELVAEVAFGTAAVSYELPLDWGTSIELYLGGRWWHVSNSVVIATVPLGVVGGGLTETWGDAVVGTRISQVFAEKWRVTLIADIGAGAADLDWQVYGSVGYMFNPYIGLTAGYRILGVDYKSRTLIYDMKQNGLLLGFNFAY